MNSDRSEVAASSAEPGAAGSLVAAPAVPDSIAPAPIIVSASAFARRCGVWQEKATSAPVYILNRGRARHVLMSIELMQLLCAPHQVPRPEDDSGVVARLLDLTDDALLIVDAGHRLTALSGPARRLFGGAATLDSCISAATAPSLTRAVDRAMHAGGVETAVLATARHPDLPIAATIAPFWRGAVIKLVDAVPAPETDSPP